MNTETIEKAANAYIGHEPECDEGVHVHAERLAFVNGARWRINSVWHDAKTEIPDAYMIVLVMNKTTGFSVNALPNGGKCPKNWVRWAYVSDLLPDGKEE